MTPTPPSRRALHPDSAPEGESDRADPADPDGTSPLLVATVLLAVGIGLVVLVLVGSRASWGSPEARDGAFDRDEQVEVVARAQISTVRVAARSCPGVIRGSGFVVDGLLFTSAHLVRFDEAVKVDRPGLPVFAPIVGTSVSLDIAVADGEELVAVDLAMAPAPAPVNERVMVSGFPDGDELEVSAATIVGYRPAAEWGVQGERVMLVDSGIRAGFSGGPVLDRDGRVVGMVAGLDRTTGLAIAIPADELSDVVELASDTWADGAGATTHVALPCE